MITIKYDKTIYLLHDEINDNIEKCENDSYIVLMFDVECWVFYKYEELKQVGVFDNYVDAINFLTATQPPLGKKA